MSETTWMDELAELVSKFSGQGAQADVEGMSPSDLKGLFYYLRGMAETVEQVRQMTGLFA
jgi:hypothetical protein